MLINHDWFITYIIWFISYSWLIIIYFDLDILDPIPCYPQDCWADYDPTTRRSHRSPYPWDQGSMPWMSWEPPQTRWNWSVSNGTWRGCSGWATSTGPWPLDCWRGLPLRIRLDVGTCFHSQMVCLSWRIPLKWMIWGSPYSRKPLTMDWAGLKPRQIIQDNDYSTDLYRR